MSESDDIFPDLDWMTLHYVGTTWLADSNSDQANEIENATQCIPKSSSEAVKLHSVRTRKVLC